MFTRKDFMWFKTICMSLELEITMYVKIQRIPTDPFRSDHCVYVHSITKVIIAIWVDDLITARKDMKDVDKVKQQLKKAFEMKDLGELNYFLGMQVH